MNQYSRDEAPGVLYWSCFFGIIDEEEFKLKLGGCQCMKQTI